MGGSALLPCAGAVAAEAELPFVEIDEGIFVRYGLQQQISAANGGAIANIGFIVGDTAVAVIDTGTTTAQGRSLKNAVRRVTDRPIRYVIASHVHLDHCFGHGAFAEELASGAAIGIGHQRLPRALAERGPFYLEQIRALDAAFADTDYVVPSSLVTGTSTIDLGGRPLRLTAWPAAHTDSDLTVFDARTATLWAADLIFAERLPTLDGNLNGWLAALDALSTLEARKIVPGHGPVSETFAALDRQRVYLGRLRDGVRAAIAEGLDITATVERLADLGRDDWLLFDAFHGRNIVTAYTELEWE